MVADRVRRLRRQRGWSAQRLADECANAGNVSLTRGTIAKIESGVRKSVTAEEVAVLARVLGVPVAELLAPELEPTADGLFTGLTSTSPHRAVVVVDAEPPPGPGSIDLGIYSLTRLAFEESGVTWDACDVAHTAENTVVLVPPDLPKSALTDQLPHRLLAALLRFNAVHATPMRLRVAIHVDLGREPDSDTDVELAHRLARANPVATVLQAAQGLVALVVSDDWYREVVSPDPAAEAATYHMIDGLPVTARIRVLGSNSEPEPTTRPDVRSYSLGTLVDALQDLPVVRQSADRRLVVDLLARRFGTGFTVPYFATVRQDLVAIVMACERQPRGLHQLVDTLHDLAGESAALAKVRAVVHTLTAPELFVAEDQQELFDMLENHTWPRLAEAYREAAGPLAVIAEPGAANPTVLFSRLAELNARPDGLLPPLLFVERLAQVGTDQIAGQLRDWNRRQAARLGLTEILRVAERETAMSAGPPQASKAYLIIQLEPEPLDAELYEMQYWRQWAIDWQPESGEDFVGALPDVRRRVAELVLDAESGWAADADGITLEFVLPRELLDLPVDQWWLDTDEPLGLNYPIVVRSLERMRNRQWHREWRRRWAQLGAQAAEHRLAPVVRPAIGDPTELRQLTAELAIDHKLTVLALDSAPPAGGPEVLAALRAGVPVIVWNREPLASDAFAQDDLRQLFDPEQDPRENVRIMRVKAYGSQDPRRHVGSHLTVLWDDPYRLVVSAGEQTTPLSSEG
jgi:transcriptional regulator with XRE-family HTH domain